VALVGCCGVNPRGLLKQTAAFREKRIVGTRSGDACLGTAPSKIEHQESGRANRHRCAH
jgi:hypothetical protein